MAKRKIGPHISSWPATTTTTTTAAAAAAAATAATTTKVGHTHKTKDSLCSCCLVDSRSATASDGYELELNTRIKNHTISNILSAFVFISIDYICCISLLLINIDNELIEE